MADWLGHLDPNTMDPDRHEPAMLTALDLVSLRLRGGPAADQAADQVAAMDTEQRGLVLMAAIAFLADDMRTVGAHVGRPPEQLLADLRTEIARRFAEVRLINGEVDGP